MFFVEISFQDIGFFRCATENSDYQTTAADIFFIPHTMSEEIKLNTFSKILQRVNYLRKQYL